MDFVALMRYSRTPDVVRAIRGLENQTVPLSAEVHSLWRESGFLGFDWGRACWVSHDNGRQVKRPRGPDLTVALRTVDGFFLTEAHWQAAMLRACEGLANRLRSPDVVLMSDYHPSYTAFFAGDGFDACLRAAVGREAEVRSIAELSEEPEPDIWDSHGFWRLRSPMPGAAKSSARAD
jgi:hypothetical protein